jgi:branched-chain amino acid transport system permease protein
MILQQLVNGLTLGSLYALIALGYTMVYGVLLMINFAHSEIFMSGAFVSLLVYQKLMAIMPAWQAFVTGIGIAFLFCAILAIAIERVAYRPLRRAARLTPLISAIGVSILLQNAVFLWISDQSMAYPQAFALRHVHVLGAEISNLQILIIGVSLVLMLMLQFFVNRTRLGTAIRATAQDASTASLMGIPVNGVIAITFFIGGALGGVAGALNGMYYGSIKYVQHGLCSRNQSLYRGGPGRYRQHPGGHVGGNHPRHSRIPRRRLHSQWLRLERCHRFFRSASHPPLQA